MIYYPNDIISVYPNLNTAYYLYTQNQSISANIPKVDKAKGKRQHLNQYI